MFVPVIGGPLLVAGGFGVLDGGRLHVVGGGGRRGAGMRSLPLLWLGQNLRPVLVEVLAVLSTGRLVSSHQHMLLSHLLHCGTPSPGSSSSLSHWP